MHLPKVLRREPGREGRGGAPPEDETRPVSTRGGTRRVQLVLEGGGEGAPGRVGCRGLLRSGSAAFALTRPRLFRAVAMPARVRRMRLCMPLAAVLQRRARVLAAIFRPPARVRTVRPAPGGSGRASACSSPRSCRLLSGSRPAFFGHVPLEEPVGREALSDSRLERCCRSPSAGGRLLNDQHDWEF